MRYKIGDAVFTSVFLAFCQLHTLAAPKEVRMSPGMKRELDTFFSNFSETDLTPFSAGKVTDQQLIRFSILHTWYNHEKEVVHKPGSMSYSLSVGIVDRTSTRFFGRPVGHHQGCPGFCTYAHGYYTFEVGDGDAVKFSQVTYLFLEAMAATMPSSMSMKPPMVLTVIFMARYSSGRNPTLTWHPESTL